MSKYVIIGLGGVGSWLAYLLASEEPEAQFTLIDYDTVEAGNLVKTPYKRSHIGLKKTTALMALLAEKGAYNVEIVDKPVQEISKEEFQKLASGAFIFDCRDKPFETLPTHIFDYPGLVKMRAGYNGWRILLDPDIKRPVWGERVEYSQRNNPYTPILVAIGLILYARGFQIPYINGDVREYLEGTLESEEGR